MVALRDVVDVNAEEPSRIRRLLAGEPIPVALVEDPDDSEAMVLRDSIEDTGSYMQLVHRRRDGSLAPGVVPPAAADDDELDDDDDALETVEATDVVEPGAPGVPTPPRGLGRMTLFVVGLAVVALVFSVALDPERRHAASAVIGVAAVITLALAALSVVVADAGRHAGVVK